jgi:hypothetical protein
MHREVHFREQRDEDEAAFVVNRASGHFCVSYWDAHNAWALISVAALRSFCRPTVFQTTKSIL